jgi:phosphonate transport system ATP-binding protein
MPTEDGTKRAIELLEKVELGHRLHNKPSQLSGGQQQRVGIARAMAQRPDIILADEPVASLDPATADRVLGLLHGICKADGIGAIVSLHQLEFAQRYADRIVGLAQGQVVFDGTPARLGRQDIERIYGTMASSRPLAPDESFTAAKTGTYA